MLREGLPPPQGHQEVRSRRRSKRFRIYLPQMPVRKETSISIWSDMRLWIGKRYTARSEKLTGQT